MAYKNVLITGCSSGIGLALAVRLAKDELKRFKVIATMRDMAKKGPLEEKAGETLEQTLQIRPLDVTCEDSVRQCVAAIPDQRVDVLVSNAGVGLIGPLECHSMAAMQRVLDTNFLGLVRLVREVFPSMKRRRQGHIVVMSSILGQQGLLFNDVYCASKFAVEGFCESLALQALKFGINISLLEPGPVVTEFEKKLYEEVASMDFSKVDDETRDIFQGFYMTYSKDVFSALGQTPEEVAEHAVQVIGASSPPFRCQTNSVYTPLTTLKHADPSGQLPLSAFHQLVFQHDRLFRASLSLLKMLQWRKRRDLGPLPRPPAPP
ncbi:retinol dehydrogenase 8-like isoform X2 [Gracilinanus agilis]|uniref:retinol dehydrogenase 8-like isoform X1 n=1 Tax=Gracilinanus agilis TaxID=191870 RepID=UPI001CFF21C8|nr:retinol dehydrogenase 8-like isoform X1 [Gracilinanus agilis]XP_044526571.1 retinol dehydrogenase 8-like isoform X2 [Gracilinanus agilis]XP_044526579.1 retinol dehydrogenase 8-like isoform X2 [Gracilinanus agilis]XP_044526587.1 retinol dehydrogenase 8-like isoform X2 [Gracilinanus agilis]XP_044526598.1 retinol dehydrogenase 8-like isoform X2 [Gracilinanus agilis]